MATPSRAALLPSGAPAGGLPAPSGRSRPLHTSLNPQVAMAYLINDIQIRLNALTALISDLAEGPDHSRRLAAAGAHAHGVAELPALIDDLVGAAVIADRRSGSRWADIGAGLGITGLAARARYGWRRIAVEWPFAVPPGTPGAAGSTASGPADHGAR